MVMETKIIPVLLLAVLLSQSKVFATENTTENSNDPYTAVEHLKFDNGLQVFLSPSQKATMATVKLIVKVGWGAEDKSNWGVSHLLEHVLFRDQGLKDEMTYLQLIKEAGGQANGSTSERETNYFGTIPPDKATWLLENIGKMILQPKMSEDYVQKEKGTVELERGRPGPVALVLGFNPMEHLYPKYLKRADFWKSEFNVSPEPGITLTQEQLSTRKLTLAQVRQHYGDYYYPANMQLFVAGKYNRAEIIYLLNQTWAKLPAATAKTLKPLPTPEPRLAPYVSQRINDYTPHVYLGTKIWDASLADKEVIAAYMEYLAHRLMKEIRNLKGQTYTASVNTHIFHDYGYSYLDFQTPKENLDENYQLARSYLQNEAEKGNLAPDKVKEAIALYLAEYKLKGQEAGNMLALAETYAQIIDQHGKFSSPYGVLAAISHEDFNLALAKHFSAKKRYEIIYRPSLFFQYDFILFFSIFAIALFVGLRRWLSKDFANDRIRWIRKVKYPPLKSLEILTLFISLLLIMHVNYVIDFVFVFLTSNLLPASIFVSDYFSGFVQIAAMIFVAQGVLSMLPRKLMVMDQKLLIKSISYYSREIPLSEIASVEAVRSAIYPFPVRRWLVSVKFRYCYFDLLFWRKGLLVNLKDGRSYFFSVAAAEKACAELAGFLPAKDNRVVNEVKAA